jgi:hypothetical protein
LLRTVDARTLDAKERRISPVSTVSCHRRITSRDAAEKVLEHFQNVAGVFAVVLVVVAGIYLLMRS